MPHKRFLSRLHLLHFPISKAVRNSHKSLLFTKLAFREGLYVFLHTVRKKSGISTILVSYIKFLSQQKKIVKYFGSISNKCGLLNDRVSSAVIILMRLTIWLFGWHFQQTAIDRNNSTQCVLILAGNDTCYSHVRNM